MIERMKRGVPSMPGSGCCLLAALLMVVSQPAPAIDPFAPDPEPVYTSPPDAQVDAVASVSSSASDDVTSLDESWATDPFERGWISWTGIDGTGDLGWSAFEGGYLYEDDAYPATGDAYYGSGSFGEEVQCSGTFSIGSTSAGGQYELAGFGMFQSPGTYAYIYYDIYRKDLRFVKVVDNVSCCDLSPDFNISIPAGAEFCILMDRSGSNYEFTLQYGTQSSTWSVQDTSGPVITEWYPSIALRYQGSRCYALLVESGSRSVIDTEIGTPRFMPVEVFPNCTYRPAPEYPAIAAQTGVEGSVVLWVYVASNGSVSDVRLYNSSGVNSLDEAALAAAWITRWTPAQNNGIAVGVWTTVTYNFILSDSPVSSGDSSEQIVIPPFPISQTAPVIPQIAQIRGDIHGYVTLEVLVGINGSALDVQIVIDPLGFGCGQAALDAVRNWAWQPAMQGGAPVEVRTSVQVRFDIE